MAESTHGIVVDHLESGVRYAISEHNFDPKVNRKVRDLKPGETVQGFQPKARLESSEGFLDSYQAPQQPNTAVNSAVDSSEALGGTAATAEGSAPAESRKKEGK